MMLKCESANKSEKILWFILNMNIRVEVLGLPDFIYQLSNDARVQDQIMQQEIVTCMK